MSSGTTTPFGRPPLSRRLTKFLVHEIECKLCDNARVVMLYILYCVTE